MANSVNPYEDDLAMQEYIEQVLYEHISRPYRTSFGIRASCPICHEGTSGSRKTRFQYYRQTMSAYCFNSGCPLSDHGAQKLFLTAMLKGVEVSAENVNYIKWYKKQQGNGFSCSEAFEPHEYTIEAPKAEENAQEPQDDMMEDTWIDLPPSVLEYCNRRRLFEAPFASKNWKLYFDVKTKRLVIPWFDDLTGKIVYWQKRALLPGDEPKYLYQPGVERPIGNVSNIRSDFPFIFMMEALLDSNFVFNSVALGGLKPSASQILELEKRFPMHRLVYLTDNPWTDKSAMIELRGSFKENKKGLVEIHKFDRMFFAWPKSIREKDVNEFACSHPEDKSFSNPEWMKTRTVSAMQMKMILNGSVNF